MNLRKRVAAAAVIFCLGTVAAAMPVGAEDTISQGVSIDGADVSGMSYLEADALVKQKVEQMRTAKITIQVGTDSIDVTASELGLNWQNKSVAKEAANLGNAGNAIKRYKEGKDLGHETRNFDLKFTVNDSTVRSFIENHCMQFEKEAQDATISSDGGGGFNLNPGVVGQVINVDESVKAVQNYIAEQWQGEPGSSVSLVVEMDEPRGNDLNLESIQDNLGSYTTYYGSTYGRNTNVERGAQLIDGHIIYPGDTFSVCDHLVPFSAENGYELGGEYENGRVVQGYGGGICQVSTTLYNALLLAEIEIVERHNHTMSVTYVPTSMDAAIAEGSMDLVFRNNLDTPIFISGYAYGGELSFTVWGKETRPANRSIEYYSETTSTVDAPATTTLYAAPDQPVGYISQVQSAMAGSTAALYKYVYVDGVQQSVEQINTSSYQATPTSYEVGTAGASDSVLNAIYSGDLAAVQAAILGVSTTAQTDATGTVTDPNAGVVTDPNTGLVTDPNTGLVTDPNTGQVTDPNTGVVTDPNAGAVTDPGDVIIMTEPVEGDVYNDGTVAW